MKTIRNGVESVRYSSLFYTLGVYVRKSILHGFRILKFFPLWKNNLKTGWHQISPHKVMKAFFLRMYDICQFFLRFFKEAFVPPYEYKEVLNQFFEVGIRSLSIISLTGFITGLVFTKQSRSSLAEFGATSWLPSLMAIAIVRALAPLVTALIVAGKVGSNIGAELGSMKVSEQIEAMEVSSTNPFKFLVVSRILATTLIVPVLAIYMALVGMLGAFVNVYNNEQTSFTSFFQAAFVRINFMTSVCLWLSQPCTASPLGSPDASTAFMRRTEPSVSAAQPTPAWSFPCS